jgi:hypothetical protein
MKNPITIHPTAPHTPTAMGILYVDANDVSPVASSQATVGSGVVGCLVRTTGAREGLDVMGDAVGVEVVGVLDGLEVVGVELGLWLGRNVGANVGANVLVLYAQSK